MSMCSAIAAAVSLLLEKRGVSIGNSGIRMAKAGRFLVVVKKVQTRHSPRSGGVVAVVVTKRVLVAAVMLSLIHI